MIPKNARQSDGHLEEQGPRAHPAQQSVNPDPGEVLRQLQRTRSVNERIERPRLRGRRIEPGFGHILFEQKEFELRVPHSVDHGGDPHLRQPHQLHGQIHHCRSVF